MEYLTLVLLLTLFADWSFTSPADGENLENFSITTSKKLGTETLPPLLFPNDSDKKFSFKPPNENEIKRLMHQTSDTESAGNSPDIKQVLTSHQGAKLFRVANLQDAPEVFPLPKSQVEDFQDDATIESDDKPEEQFRNSKLTANIDRQIFDEDIEVLPRQLSHGHIIAIISALLATLLIVVYVGFISWRYYIQKRYGMRERLVTHDDYYNYDERTFNL